MNIGTVYKNRYLQKILGGRLMLLEINGHEKRISTTILTTSKTKNIRHIFSYIPEFVEKIVGGIVGIDTNYIDGKSDQSLKKSRWW